MVKKMQNQRDQTSSRHMLVTGGAGFIGSHLSEALLDAGHSVTVVDDLSTGYYENISHLEENPAFRFVDGSVTSESLMDELISGSSVVFHLAAAVGVELIVSDPVRTIETNVLGTDVVLRVASRYGSKVLLASTSEIYGKNGTVPYEEDDDRIVGPTTKARWSYSASKAVDEFLALAYFKQKQLPVAIFRLFNTIGPRQRGQYGMVVPRFVKQVLDGKPITVYDDGLQTRCFCDVLDVVKGIMLLETSPNAIGQVFNIGSTEEISILDLAKRVLDHASTISAAGFEMGNPSSEIQFIPYEQAYEGGFEDMRRRIPDIGKIRRETGWRPSVDLDESLRRIFSWYIEQADPISAAKTVSREFNPRSEP